VWLKQRPGKWFEGLADIAYQARMYSAEDLDYLDRQFAEAYRLAGGDELIRKRIRFFEGGWRLAEHHIRECRLLERMQAEKTPQATAELAQQLLAARQARRAFWAKYREEPRFPGQEKGPCEDYRYVIEQLGRIDVEGPEKAALALVGLRLASEAPETYKTLLAHYRAGAAEADAPLIQALESAGAFELTRTTPNLARNPSFEPGDGNAEPWWQVAPSGGSFSFEDGVAHIRGADAGLLVQTIPVSPGEHIVGTVECRLRADSPAHAGLGVSWKDKTGGWLQSYETVGFDVKNLPPADDWQKMLCRHVVPAGAAAAVFYLGTWRLKPDEVVEFRNPYFGKIAEGVAGPAPPEN